MFEHSKKKFMAAYAASLNGELFFNLKGCYWQKSMHINDTHIESTKDSYNYSCLLKENNYGNFSENKESRKKLVDSVAFDFGGFS